MSTISAAHNAGRLAQVLAQLQSSTAPYLTVALLTVPLSTISFYLFGTTPVLKGQSLGILVPIVGIGIAGLLWLICASPTKTTRQLALFGLTLLSLWAYTTIRSLSLNEPYNYTAWLLPIFVIMVILKPPNRSEALKAADFFVFGLLGIAMLSHILHVTGIHEFPHYFYQIRYPEIIQTILPMDDLGLAYRWEGAFGSVSDAGPMGAFIFVFGIFRSGAKRIVILAGGLFILIFAFSFSSIFATLAALTFLVASTLSKQSPRRTPLLFVTLFVGQFALIAIYISFFDPTFNGRINIWGQYISEWPNHLLFGTGGEFISSRTDLFSHDHGHNLYVDTLLRYGAVGFILFMAVLVMLICLSWKAFKINSNVPIVILIVFALCIVGESLVLWRYNGAVTSWLIISALIANADIDNVKKISSLTKTH